MPHKLFSEHATFSRRFAVLLLALVFALQSGCARHHRPSEPPKPPAAPETQFQSMLGKVTIVAAEPLQWVAWTGAVRTGGLDNYSGNGAGCPIEPGGCSGADCVAVVLAEIVVCAAVVTAVEAAKAPKKNTAEKSKNVQGDILSPDAIQNKLLGQVVAHAKSSRVALVNVSPESAQKATQENDYRQLAALGVDTVLVVGMKQVFDGTQSGKSDLSLLLDMMAHVRLISTRDNSEIFSGDYFYHGKRLRYSEWSANNAERLVSAMQKGYESLGRDIGDRIFLLYPFAERLAKDGSGSCGLAMFGPKDDRADDLSPQLSWQSFPRESDLSSVPGDIKQVKNVRYELMLATGETGESPEVIYRRDGLKGTTHKIEMALEPNTRYFWSVRAHFTFNGRQRVTEWATYCPFGQQLVVSGSLYRFYTPKV